MAVSYIGSQAGTNTLTPPTHQAGDLFIGFGFRDGSNSTPTKPGDWNQLETVTSNSAGTMFAWKLAASSAEAFGTWSNATTVLLLVYRGVDQVTPVGDSAVLTGSNTTVLYPALTLTVGDGTSWVAGLAAHRSIDTNVQDAPTGMLNRIADQTGADEAAGHDTNGGVSSWSQQSVSVGGTSSGWAGVTVEIIEASGGGTEHTKDFDETITVSEVFLRAITRSVTETTTTSDTLSKSTTHSFLETSTLSEVFSIVHGYVRTLADTSTMTDSVSRVFTRIESETSTLTDLLSNTYTRIIGETTTVTDSLVKGVSRTLTDASITLSEVFTLVETTIKEFSETVNLTESFVKTSTRILSDAETITDTILKATSKSITEATIVLSETVLKTYTRAIEETVILSEIFTNSYVYIRGFTETVTTSDTITKIFILLREYTDQLSIQDWLWRKFKRVGSLFTKQNSNSSPWIKQNSENSTWKNKDEFDFETEWE